MKKTEAAHIEAAGGRWSKAMAAASLEIRQDRRLTGLDKIRDTIAFEAALQATGFPARPLVLPKSCGTGLQDTQEICEQILERAVKAATPSANETLMK